jgi:enamine deaminase RidA (YjgF/YER057c/UK114 family)
MRAGAATTASGPRRLALLALARDSPTPYLLGVTLQPINPRTLGAPRGFSHGMLAPAGGRLLFVAGQTARDEDGNLHGGNQPQEWEQCLRNVAEVVRAAGGGVRDIGRLTIYVTDRADYLANLTPIGRAYRRVMGNHYPAMALVEVKGLVDEGATVEIEATAVIPSHTSEGELRPTDPPRAPDPLPESPAEE